MRKFIASLLILAVVVVGFGAAAIHSRRKGPVLTAVSTATITPLNVRDSEAVADRPGIIEVRARAVFTNIGGLDKEEFWWSLEVARDYEKIWRQDYRPRSFHVGRGITEIEFSQDLQMPPGEYHVWLAIRQAGTFRDRDGVTIIEIDPPFVSETWRAVVW
jgi:hypothetical protein